jgi:hypothetical protein
LNRSLVKTHAIRWKCSVTGAVGTGTNRFEKEAAERLATELNERFPDIDHEAVIPAPAGAEPAEAEPLRSPAVEG